MKQHNRRARERKWFDSGHARLCLLGSYRRRPGFVQALAEQGHRRQKVRRYTPVQKLEMVFVSLLAGAKAVAHSGTTLRVDAALQAAFGRPGCAEQSVLADTLNAATAADVATLRTVVEASWQAHSATRQHDFARAILVLDLDLSPLPARRRADGSERGYMGRGRSKTGRKLVRVRAAASQETLWEEVVPGRTVDTLAVVQQAVAAVERLLNLEAETAAVVARRARIEWRLDSGWGSEATLNWLLARGYQVTGKFKAYSRVQKVVRPITAWESTMSSGRAVAAVPQPVPLARPCVQYAVRTPSKDNPGGYYHAVLCSSRTDLPMQAVVTHYDARAGMEADLKGDKRGRGLGVIRKQKLPAQQMVVLLGQWVHNVRLWARRWLARSAPRLERFGIVRLVQQVCAVPGRIKLTPTGVSRVRLRREHPCARDVCRGLSSLCPSSQTLGLLG